MFPYTALAIALLSGLVSSQSCPGDDPTLIPWSPGNDPSLDIVIDGVGYLLNDSANLNTIDIRNGGRLVIQDYGPGSPPISLRTRQILIQMDGAFFVGSEDCPYLGSLEIILWGMIGDGGAEDSAFGRKFIGVAPTGSIMLHGRPKMAWTRLTATLPAGSPARTVLELADDVSSWDVGDQIVVASSDYDQEHTEVFTLADCPACTNSQVLIQESPAYTHYGEVESGADMRAEVGLLTRNVKIRGEVEPDCYGSPLCSYGFAQGLDLFGGQTQVLVSFAMAHFSDIELVDMGQQTLGAYPIHFHRTGPSYGAYAKRLSIHHSRSRCVTIHGAQHILVEDVVGYNALGHCFFLEDGYEFNNTLRHNLGLVTKSGSLLPHDRDEETCLGMLDAVYPGYTPDPDSECKAHSVFWIAHPDNIIEDNAAVGGEFGYFYVFHREPTGPSAGELPPYHGERSPLTLFARNTAHSAKQCGLQLDRGVKISAADVNDPREFLALVQYARFSPHENRNLSEPRAPAIIDQFTSYKNFIGSETRGGDIVIRDSSFVDNVIGTIARSETTLPYDIGSHHEISNSQYNGRSLNMRDDSFDTSYPQRGVELSDGPVVVNECVFSGYLADGAIYNVSSAFGFLPRHQGQHSARNTVRNCVFLDESARLWLGEPGGEFGDFLYDGDQNMVLVDVDGAISGVAGAHIVRADMDILNPTGSQCTINADFNAAVCTGYQYGQIYVEASTTSLTLSVYSQENAAATPYTLSGVTRSDGGNYSYYNYQPLVVTSQGYSLNWDGVAPDNIIISPHNFVSGSSVNTNLCYPTGTSFTINFEEWDQLSDTVLTSTPLTEGNGLADVINDPNGLTYFWDDAARLLNMKILQRYPLSGYNYCSDQGCERYNIQANIVNQDVSDCTA